MEAFENSDKELLEKKELARKCLEVEPLPPTKEEKKKIQSEILSFFSLHEENLSIICEKLNEYVENLNYLISHNSEKEKISAIVEKISKLKDVIKIELKGFREIRKSYNRIQ